MNEQIDKVKELIKNRYNPRYCGYTEMRSEGNYTDVFQDGCDCGESQVLYEIGCLLGMDLKEPEEQDFDY
ncbi:hypothetical protein ACEU2D_14370 [Brevibacillus laterosporus]|uniref:hypothetical protein n=1 Tax=Brevibacillus laterosporus TaxID=1465 RepID=UPI0035A67CCA